MILDILLGVFAYLMGSLSAAVIVCRAAGLPDPRTEGSKNPGATNVLRLGGKKLAIITLLLDVLKGVIPVGIALMVGADPITTGLVMLAAFLGHLYPIFFQFKGGKGVATAFGAIATLSWPVGLMLVGTWIVMAVLFRRSSLAALTATILAPTYLYFWQRSEQDIFLEKISVMEGASKIEEPIIYVLFVALISLILIWRHKGNIQRLLVGSEPKIGKK